MASCLLLFTDIFLVECKVHDSPDQNQVASISHNIVEEEEIWENGRPSIPHAPRGPHIAGDSPKAIMATVGTPVHVPCKARNLGSKSVSWIRHRDLHVLTVSSFTFTNDERFSAHRDPSSGDWVLVLRHPQPSDSGYYECSISTKPVTAISVRLDVVVPSAQLLGDDSLFLDKGSTLNLTCVLHFSPTPPEFILWYHRDKLVNYGTRGGRKIQVETIHRGKKTWSFLLVENTTLKDSGKYSCKPSNANMVSVLVHVIKSETPEAMKTTTSGASSIYSNPLEKETPLLLLLLVLFSLVVCSLVNSSFLSLPATASAIPSSISPSPYFASSKCHLCIPLLVERRTKKMGV
ncbi:hypothetical protein SK128_023541 [Halocaridina rubra]|uniref:Ig-like domain-containing protein n=1 Tax=Halocaridina rubra TaxID=373956 RepID=A0AAN8X530_HALRR